VPKRKVKEATPRKKMSLRNIIILPAVILVAVLAGLIITHFFPPPNVLSVCLKTKDADPYNVYPRVLLYIDNKKYLFPDTLGKTIEKGKECLHVIRVDDVGDQLHVQYIRPIQLSMPDLMKIYSNNSNIINVVDNSTGKILNKAVDLTKYDISYSYYSDQGNFTKINSTGPMPPFSNTFFGRIDLVSK
jgi:hypothetical protein